MESCTKRVTTWQYNFSRVLNGKQKLLRKRGFKTKKEAIEVPLQVFFCERGVVNPSKNYSLEK
ncbi:Arm DNA-binding domain-containing protein [Lysinibacillus fusiformis]|uniref:Arm DNA-binding domain-containing protein n=1 Tax=Lysinibacillus fusiformis TaxID=28031 RepID=UPI001E4AE2B8|nr:Arm DNA-binding domain-containing protein [Lysinibacillus fusiformis]MCE4045578.1 Arm DNA-binding domain-containing protein [Lysinibacillus fusiformis]